MRKTGIVIHHSSTEDGATFDTAAMRKYHIETKGWSDIGYHWIIESVGGHIQIVMGRYPDADGAHCKDWGANRTHFGVCIVGNYDRATPPPDIWDGSIRFCRWICREYGIRPGDVVGHWEAQQYGGVPEGARKTCPGKLFDINVFRGALA